MRRSSPRLVANFTVLLCSIAIALCTASPLDPTPTSQFKQDYLRFWPTGDGNDLRSFSAGIASDLFVFSFSKLESICSKVIKLAGGFCFPRTPTTKSTRIETKWSFAISPSIELSATFESCVNRLEDSTQWLLPHPQVRLLDWGAEWSRWARLESVFLSESD